MFPKKAAAFYPMPNTGTILDISAGSWVDGVNGQSILNGGYALFSGIGALPNMFKTTIAASMAGTTLLAYPDATAHVHDTETTMNQARIEGLMRNAMNEVGPHCTNNDNLVHSNRLFFTVSVDYDATALFDIIKKFCEKRDSDRNEVIELEMIDPNTGKAYKYFNPIVEVWDSLSGLKTRDAKEKMDKADVGSRDMNMLAMNFNMGKSQIVEQAPDLTAKYGIYLLVTAHVGQKYDLDPYKPSVRKLRWMGSEVTLKRVPENTTFNTGNFYVVSKMQPLTDKRTDLYPRSPDDKDTESPDLIEVTLVNQRGKFGFSNLPLPLVVSQKEGLQHTLSNFIYLRYEGKYGIVGNDRFYAFALTPDKKMQRTTLRTVFRENYDVRRAALILAEMRYMFTHNLSKYEKYFTTPEQLYEDIKNKGYDWDILLQTRFWHGPLKKSKDDIPYLSTMDLLRMRVGEYHPYWYPVKEKDLKVIKAVKDDSKDVESTS